MAEPMPKCSHCGAEDSIVETIWCFYCDKCEWWGTTPDKIIYDTPRDEDFRSPGKVPRRPTS